MNETIALEVRSVCCRFGGLTALEDITLRVPAGQRRVLIGTNGAGKSTLFNVINGQIRPTAGRVLMHGADMTDQPVHERARLGLSRTFQITSLFSELTVMENMTIAVQALDPAHFTFYRPLAAFARISEQVRTALERWHLWDLRAERVKHLPYGTQRQLEIVLALAGNPRVLLLDEPMAGLSARETQHAIDVVKALDPSITVLVIEHDLQAAFAMADWVTAMDRGRIVADGPPDQIRGQGDLERLYTGMAPLASVR
jgi:branched-chain amino acid transport system ATP-binding protein